MLLHLITKPSMILSVIVLALSAVLYTAGKEAPDGKSVNLFRGAKSTVTGNVEKKRATYHLLPGGRVAYATSAFIGKRLNRYLIKVSVRVKGDGIARITLGITGQKEQSITVTLTPMWLSHSLIWPPPEEKEPAPLTGDKVTITLAVEIVGNNVCSTKDFLLHIDKRAPASAELEDVDAKLKGVPVPPDLVNIVDLAKIRVTPPGFLLYRVRDGDDGTGIMADSIGESMCTMFDQILGEEKPLYLNRYGQDIEAACLEKTNGDRILSATNWTKKRVTADIGVNMPRGNYKMLKRDLVKVTKVVLNGKQKLSEEDLKKFRIILEPGEANIFLIRKTQSDRTK